MIRSEEIWGTRGICRRSETICGMCVLKEEKSTFISSVPCHRNLRSHEHFGSEIFFKLNCKYYSLIIKYWLTKIVDVVNLVFNTFEDICVDLLRDLNSKVLQLNLKRHQPFSSQHTETERDSMSSNRNSIYKTWNIKIIIRLLENLPNLNLNYNTNLSNQFLLFSGHEIPARNSDKSSRLSYLSQLRDRRTVGSESYRLRFACVLWSTEHSTTD